MMYRTRFKKEIVAEFLPPKRKSKKQKLILLCDGMPSIPRKQPLSEFLSEKGYWVVYPRYRGSWESDGIFLEKPPQQDLFDIIDELLLKKEIQETAFGQKFQLSPDEIFVIGGSFGGATSILASLDPRIKKCIANCPVIDWSLLQKEEKLETSNESYVAYIKESFGNAYRLSEKNWKRLYTGTYFNPTHHAKELDPSKFRLFHAKDDPYIPFESVKTFSKITGAKLTLLNKGGHLSTDYIVRKYWTEIHKFFSF